MSAIAILCKEYASYQSHADFFYFFFTRQSNAESRYTLLTASFFLLESLFGNHISNLIPKKSLSMFSSKVCEHHDQWK